MKSWRSRPMPVVVVLLLWQLATGLLIAGPATAAAHSARAAGTAAAHCHADDGHGGEGPSPDRSDAPDGGGDSDCCHNMATCDCLCAQSVAAIPPALAGPQVRADHPATVDLRSPAPTRRTPEVLRPPI